MGKNYVRDGTKTEDIHFRLPGDRREVLQKMAHQEQRTISEMMRILIEEGAQRRLATSGTTNSPMNGASVDRA